MRHRCAWGALAVVLTATTSAAQIYDRADIDSAGHVQIVTSKGRAIRPPRDSGQVGADHIAISPDSTAVGWLALYPNCCTTYPVPLKLVLLIAGKRRAIAGGGLPIWEWKFTEDSRYVAIRQAPVHGDAPQHYELRVVATGKLVDSYDGGSRRRRAPPWIRIL
jgi:hypothetical protein